MKRRSQCFLDCSPAAPRYFFYFLYQEKKKLGWFSTFRVMEDLHSSEGRRFQPGKMRTGWRDVLRGMRRIFSSLFFSRTLSSTLEASARLSSILLVSLSHLPEDGARLFRLHLSAALFKRSDGWRKLGAAGFLCASGFIQHSRGRNTGLLLCTGLRVLLHSSFCFLTLQLIASLQAPPPLTLS